MRWQRRFQSCFSESQILILKPGQAQSIFSASIFADRRISTPTSAKEKEIHPFNVVHDDLANYSTCNLLPANNVCQLNGTDRRTVIHGCLSLVLIFDVCDSDDVPRRFSIVILVIDAHAYEGSVVWLPFQVPQLHMTLLVFSWIARSPPILHVSIVITGPDPITTRRHPR